MSVPNTFDNQSGTIPLSELDANFSYLDSAKLDAAGGTLTGPTVVSVSSADAALRITQTGTGNALLVEDTTNPDATPFVVDVNGFVVVGHTAALPIAPGNAYPLFQLQSNISSADYASMGAVNWVAASNSSSFQFSKSRSGIIGTQTIINNSDALGRFNFNGDDGAAFINAARIESFVDGVPGVNDMPGRLVFSTTADGAASPTERMRIDASGQVGVGTTPQAGRTLTVEKNITGSTGSYAQINAGSIQPDVTSVAYYFSSFASTANVNFSIGSIVHYSANGVSTFSNVTAGGAINVQTGFEVGSGFTGATSNYGFRSRINAGAGRWNFRADGTADNYFAGNVGIGTSAPAVKLQVEDIGSSQVRAFETGSSVDLRMNAAAGATLSGVVGTFSNHPLVFFTNSTAKMRISTSGQIGIGTSAPDASAALDVTSTTGGILFPRMTTAQRDAIASPANGLVLYNTSTDKLQVRAAAAWVDLH